MTLRKIDKYSDIKVAEGQMVIIPWDNRVLEMPPYVNEKSPVAQWVKEAPNSGGSIKRCAATMDYLSLGITIPAWTNFRFSRSEGDDNWGFICDQFEGHNGHETEPFRSQPFAFEQTGSCPMTKVRDIENSGYPKLVNPYRIITAPGWSTLVLPVMYEPSRHYSVLPGIINTDYYHEVNCVLNLIGSESFTIPWGAPLMHLIPVKRSTMSHTLELLDDSAFKYVIGRGFGSGALKPPGHGWSSSRMYRAYRMRRDAELAESSKKKKWGRNK